MKFASLLQKLLLAYLLAPGCGALRAMQALLAPVTTLHENTFKESLRETLKKEHEAKIRAVSAMLKTASTNTTKTLTNIKPL